MLPRRSPWPRLLVVVAIPLFAAPLSAQTGAAAAWHASPAAQLKTALRDLAAAQGRYHAARGTYAASVTPLRLAPGPEVRLEITAATRTGWQARAVHRDRPGLSCVIFVGGIPGLESPRTDGDREMAGEDGIPLCDRMR
jgi:hypothetical protein